MVGIFRNYFIHWFRILCHTWMMTYKCDNLDLLTSYLRSISSVLRYAENHFLIVLSVLSSDCSDYVYVCDSELITFKILNSEKLKNHIQSNQMSVMDISTLMLVLWRHIAEWKVMFGKAQCHDAEELVFFVLPYSFQDLKIECFLFYLCWRNSFVGCNFFGIGKANQNVFDLWFWYSCSIISLSRTCQFVSGTHQNPRFHHQLLFSPVLYV